MLHFRCLHLNTTSIYIVSTKWRFTRQNPHQLAILEYICIWLLRSNLFLVYNTTIVKRKEGKLHSVWTKVDLQNLYDVCAALGLKDTWKCRWTFLYSLYLMKNVFLLVLPLPSSSRSTPPPLFVLSNDSVCSLPI